MAADIAPELTHAPSLSAFLCTYEEVLERIDAIDPDAYDRTRNYLDGAVTWLSPFLTHGIISTRTIADRVLARHAPDACYRLLFELAWREFFHRQWQLLGNAIFSDVLQPQSDVASELPPQAVLQADTGIAVIDASLRQLLETGTLHNHARLWIAGLTCDTARTSWPEPARWLHYHLLDGDLASNTLSWQWVAGTFSQRAYIANQDNVNKFSRQLQKNTWLDVPYETLARMPIPDALQARAAPHLPCRVSDQPCEQWPTDTAAQRLHLRSVWDLDPTTPTEASTSAVFVDTGHDARWPMSENRWRFIRHWAAQCRAPVVAGHLDTLKKHCAGRTVTRVEYPACEGWPGDVYSRAWLFPMPPKPFKSFSKYWKQVRASVGLPP